MWAKNHFLNFLFVAFMKREVDEMRLRSKIDEERLAKHRECYVLIGFY